MTEMKKISMAKRKSESGVKSENGEEKKKKKKKKKKNGESGAAVAWKSQ